jgi:hypothetical protein
MKTLVISLIALMISPATAMGQFKFRDLNSRSVELTERGAPAFVYNYGTMLKEGTAPDRARCCYLYPVYAPNGVVVTDDFQHQDAQAAGRACRSWTSFLQRLPAGPRGHETAPRAGVGSPSGTLHQR